MSGGRPNRLEHEVWFAAARDRARYAIGHYGPGEVGIDRVMESANALRAGVRQREHRAPRVTRQAEREHLAHLRQQARSRRALLNRLRGLARGLHRAGAGILFRDIFDHNQRSRDVLIALAGFFAELPQVLFADRAMLLSFLKIVNDTLAFQMARQGAASARVRFGAASR